ncbi:MAG: extracellular solute-binding protein [Candidatus Pacebacteria bacterium]|nr:extracellular solute-binding protein [Candidatus Paceibacterota bacterium]
MPDIPLPKPQPPTSPSKITPPPVMPQSAAPVPPPGLPRPPVQPAPSTPAGLPPIAPKPVTPSPLPPVAPKPPVGLPMPPRPPAPVGSAPPSSVKKEDASSTSAQPKIATASSPLKKFLPFIIGGVVLLLIALGAFAFFNSQGSQSVSVDPQLTTNRTTTSTTTNNAESGRQTVPEKKTQITYWGLWETSDVLEQAFTEFETLNPGVEVVYQKQSHLDYRQRLQTAVASGNGPDIFRYHSSWVPMLSDDLSALPSKVMTTDVYQQTFYPVAAQMLQLNGQIVGIPLMYDGLALYYNKEVLDAAGEQPPTSWTELKTLASKLTVRSGNDIKRAGLAVGNASTTEHFSDIIGLLMLQNGGDPTDLTTKEAQEAMIFYTNFVAKDRVWDDKLPSSTVAFAREDAAMMLAPSWRAHEVLEINPNLDFGIVSTPTLGSKRIAWASFWAEGVSSKSTNKDASWELLKYLSSKEVMQKLYNEQSKTRAFGEIYSRVDLANTLASDPLVAPFLADAPYAQSRYLTSYTHDKGLNDNLIKYYQDAVNALLKGDDITKVIDTLSLGSQQVLRQYNID